MPTAVPAEPPCPRVDAHDVRDAMRRPGVAAVAGRIDQTLRIERTRPSPTVGCHPQAGRQAASVGSARSDRGVADGGGCPSWNQSSRPTSPGHYAYRPAEARTTRSAAFIVG